ncbi:hypothetical protein AB5N19_02416 [Seiridium cardinale]
MAERHPHGSEGKDQITPLTNGNVDGVVFFLVKNASAKGNILSKLPLAHRDSVKRAQPRKQRHNFDE